jgi:putative DNA primase/helicase
MVATGWPGWATLSASGIEALVLPPLPIAATVIIAADHDLNGIGQGAAHKAARRWLAEGRRVRIPLPPEPDTDWNDVLRGKGSQDQETCYAA